MTKKLKEFDNKEAYNENFLKDTTPDDIPEIVHAHEVPKYERITFLNMRDPGLDVEFPYASATHPFKRYHLFHGHEYDLPVEVIKHLEGTNEWDPYSCHTRLYGVGQNERGDQMPIVTGYKPNFQCRSVRK